MAPSDAGAAPALVSTKLLKFRLSILRIVGVTVGWGSPFEFEATVLLGFSRFRTPVARVPPQKGFLGGRRDDMVVLPHG